MTQLFYSLGGVVTIVTLILFTPLMFVNESGISMGEPFYNLNIPFIHRTFNWLMILLYILTPLIGGIMCGLISKSKGFIYGIAAILLTNVMYICIIIITTLYTKTSISDSTTVDYITSSLDDKILVALIKLPMSIILAGLGGFVGTKIRQNKLLIPVILFIFMAISSVLSLHIYNTTQARRITIIYRPFATPIKWNKYYFEAIPQILTRWNIQ